jgi:serine/threonine-protein kinase
MTEGLDPQQMVIGVHEGDILAGKYRIERILGTGGMGVVVAAFHIHLEERVAIKFLLPDALAKQEVVTRFAREARAAVKIKSEHVARVLDVGTLETGAPYMVMEYLDGSDLGAWVQQHGALDIEQAAEFILQACEAIADAHSLGIVHRDLKPSNLFCVKRSDGLLSIKVLDFGISKLTSFGDSGADMGMTKTSSVLGSPLYMSPEQMLSSRDVDVRTDIWALGVILYELVVGKVPFNGDTLAELCVKIATMPAPPLRDRLPDAPLALQEVIQRCMDKDRTKRYSNVAELSLALGPFAPKRARASVERITRVIQAAGLTASALNLPPSSEAPHAASHTQAAWGQTKSPTLWRRAGAPVGIVGLLVAIVGVTGWFWAQKPQKPSEATASPLSTTSGTGISATAPSAAATNSPVANAAGSTVEASTKSTLVQPRVSAPARPAGAAATPAHATPGAKRETTATNPSRASEATANVCVPACRGAQVCARGQCVSACNPPCAANEACTPKGMCVSACNPPCPDTEKCVAGGRCTPR